MEKSNNLYRLFQRKYHFLFHLSLNCIPLLAKKVAGYNLAKLQRMQRMPRTFKVGQWWSMMVMSLCQESFIIVLQVSRVFHEWSKGVKVLSRMYLDCSRMLEQDNQRIFNFASWLLCGWFEGALKIHTILK